MVKVAIVGSGGIATKHVEALGRIDAVKIISIYDIIEEKAQKLAQLCGAKPFTNFERSIEDADLVYILTPPSYHKDIAIHAMREGKHVMIEKPITIKIEDAEEIVNASHQYSRKAMVGFNMRYRLGYRKLKEIYASGKIGGAFHLWSQRMGMSRPSHNWRTHPEMLCGFTIESLSHDIDMFQWICNAKVESVYGNVKSSNPDLVGYDDNSLVILNLNNGTTASIQASWSSYLEFNSRGVNGAEGRVMISGRGTWDFDTFKYRIKGMDFEVEEPIDDPLDLKSYYEENLHFIDCVQNDKTPETTVEYGLQILKISHAIRESSELNKLITI